MGSIIIILFFGITSVIFYLFVKNRLLGWGKRRLLHDSKITKHIMQGFGSVKELKIMALENFFINQFNYHNNSKAKIIARLTTILQVPRLYLEVLSIIGLSGFVIFLIYLNIPSDELIPTIGIFVASAFRLIPSINRIMSSLQSIRYSGPVIDRLHEEFRLISENYLINENSNNINDFNFNKKIEIKNICFTYPEAKNKSLININFSVNKGDCIGFMGKSGSGKSTLIDVLTGLLNPQSGKVIVDGKDIFKNIKKWQNKIGYVPQSIFLTDDSIKNNIAYGVSDSDLNYQSLNKSIKEANIDEFIENLPLGFETNVGEKGVKISGGQRQRIGIARALYNNPEILVLDEATSALDVKTEAEIIRTINSLKGGKTIFIVTHRSSTLKDCDKIYELNSGKIIND